MKTLLALSLSFTSLSLVACSVQSGPCDSGEFYLPDSLDASRYASPDDLGTCQPLRGERKGCLDTSWCDDGLTCAGHICRNMVEICSTPAFWRDCK